jgi:hypothetical protein
MKKILFLIAMTYLVFTTNAQIDSIYIYSSNNIIYKQNINSIDSITFYKSYLPIIITTLPKDITYSTAISGGQVKFDGNTTITSKGVCWSNSANPTISLSTKTSDGSGIESFVSNISGLSPKTTYYVRSYATNINGTSYGNQYSFTTLATIPTVYTNSINNITSSTSNSGGNISFDGGSTVLARGVCWNTSGNPLVSNNKTTDGSGNGNFTSLLSNLTPNTLYYYRAYATNSIGTGYGSQSSFTTTTQPTISTSTISNITTTSALGGGKIVSASNESVLSSGVCWSTTTLPTISNSHTSDGTSVGIFISSITGLTSNTKYYLRAYYTMSYGTVYGDEVSFTTNAETKLSIGMQYLGGLIAYLDASGKHGFVVTSNSNWQIPAPWAPNTDCVSTANFNEIEPYNTYGITKSGGRRNTDIIYAYFGDGNYAASNCQNLTIGSANKGDWYLPSLGEMEQIILNKDKLQNLTIPPFDQIWTSTTIEDVFYCYAYYWSMEFNKSDKTWSKKDYKSFYPIRAF